MSTSTTIYLAGPMRGVPAYNFPAFDKAADYLRSLGHRVISPADIDREHGFNEDSPEPSARDLREMILRDLAALALCDAIALMPGWEDSAGVAVELALAKMLGLAVLDADTGKPMPRTTPPAFLAQNTASTATRSKIPRTSQTHRDEARHR